MIITFLDANVPIHATGADELLRVRCGEILRELTRGHHECWSSVEVLQEILHVGIRRNLRQRAHETLDLVHRALPGRIQAIVGDDVLRADELGGSLPHLQARDLVHLATMERLGSTTIISTDTGFDRVPGIRRLDPSLLATWRDEVFVAR